MKTGWLLLLGLLGCVVVRGADLGIGLVDMEELVRRHPNTAGDKKTLDAALKQYEGERDTKRARLDDLRREYEAAVREADNPALNETARKNLETEALKKREVLIEADRHLAETVQLRRKQLSEQETRMLRRTTADLRDAIAKVAQRKKLSLVLFSATVAYSAKENDITADVLRALGVDPDALPPGDADVPANETPAERGAKR